MPKREFLTPEKYKEKYPKLPPRDILPTGAVLVKLIDESGYKISDVEREKILQLDKPAEIRAYLAAQTVNLSSITAKNDFAKFLALLDIPSSLVIYHFQNMAACQRAIGYAEDALTVGNLSASDKAELINTMILGIHAQGKLIQNAAFLVRSLFEKKPVKEPRYLKRDVPKPARLPPPPPPRNLPPDILSDTSNGLAKGSFD